MEIETTQESLCVAFSGITARVHYSDEEAYESLCNQCWHTITAQSAVSVDYRITREGSLWQLQRDGLLLYSEDSSQLIVQRLLHDISTVLATRTTTNLLFHAAAIAKNGMGVILPGATGSGKSTFAAWHALHGYDFLTDELVAVSPDGASMWGFVRPIRLRTGSGFLLPYLSQKTKSEQLFDQLEDGAVLVNPESLGAANITYKAKPSLIVFPQFATEPQVTVKTLSVGETVFRLMQLMLNGRGRVNDVLPPIAAIARRVPAVAIQYNDMTLSRDWIEKYWPVPIASNSS